jgi:hypothetical protein
MALGSEHLGKEKALVKKGDDSTKFKTDVYGFLDEFLHDDDEEIVVSTRNKYFGHAAKVFLEDMNFTFLNSEVTSLRLVISLVKSEFKFIDHMEDQVTLKLPYDWDAMESDVRAHVSLNPVVKKEAVQRDESKWNTPGGNSEEDVVDGVKAWVQGIQQKVNIDAAEAAEMAKKFIKKAYHDKNETIYTAKGNPDVKLVSGVYNNLEQLIRKNGWKDQFESDYKMTVREYFRNNSDIEGIEKTLLAEFGFDYIADETIVTEHKYWTNRIVEIKYKDQDQDDVEGKVDNVDMLEFENRFPDFDDDIAATAPTITPPPPPNDNLTGHLNGLTPSPVTANSGEYKTLKTFTDETPIFIVGTSVNGSDDFSLQSDFSSFTLECGDDEEDVETDGFVKILTLNEFKEHRDLILECEVGVVCVSNMSGNIEIGAKNGAGYLTSNFDLSTYILDQLSDDFNVVVKLPEGSYVMEVNEMTVDLVLRKFD